MTHKEIEKARKERNRYLFGLVIFLVWLILKFGYGMYLHSTGAVQPQWTMLAIGVFRVILIIYIIAMTWRFCRSIAVGKLWASINAMFSPILFIFQLIGLLILFSKRVVPNNE